MMESIVRVLPFALRKLFLHLSVAQQLSEFICMCPQSSTACTVLHTRAVQCILYGMTVLNNAHPPGCIIILIK